MRESIYTTPLLYMSPDVYDIRQVGNRTLSAVNILLANLRRFDVEHVRL